MIDVKIIFHVCLKAYDICRIIVFSQFINSGQFTLSAYLFFPILNSPCSVLGMGIPGLISILRICWPSGTVHAIMS